MKPLSLLFVDDEDEFIATIKEFFDSLDYIVHTSGSGREALLQSLKITSPKPFFSIFQCRIWTAQKPCA